MSTHSAVRINGVAISAARILELGGRPDQLPAGDYWYDRTAGLWGLVGGGTRGVIAAGLPLGDLPDGVSGRGLTGVFINRREITPDEWAYLSRLLGSPIAPGRYFLDAHGNAGLEGGMALVNLYQQARQAGARSSGGRATYMSSGTGGGYYDPSTGDSFFSFRDSSGKSYSTS